MSASLERLVYMDNQIATAFRTQGAEKDASATYDHIWHFWDPRMRRLILEHLEAGGSGLSDVAGNAVARLRDGGEPQPETKATEFNHRGDPDLMSDAG